MARANDEVAELLQELCDLIQITGGDAFKIRAYEKAARAIGGHYEDIATLDRKGLQAIPGVGASVVKKIEEYLANGSIGQVDEMRERIPPGVRALTAIPTLGPKKALLLYDNLGIASVDELAAAIREGRLRGQQGFGPKAEENLLRGIDLLRNSGQRALIDTATTLAEEIVAALAPLTESCRYAGSLRRMKETIGDIDVLAVSNDSEPVMTEFVNLPVVANVIARGDKKTSIRTTAGIQVDLRVVGSESLGAALQYFTGSKEHNVHIREIAVRAGLKLSEYGLFDAESGDLIASRTEEEVYERLGLPWIPPPLREDGGEVEAALRGSLPELVLLEDLRGDLHTHTDLTDGVASLEEMVAAAAGRGYEYYVITDHAPDLVMQRMTDDKALAQRAEVRALAGEYPGMALLHGSELNIGPAGRVDWDADFLSGFDLCVASVHSHFGQERAETTRRLIKAVENPHVHVLGHPTARRMGKRPRIDADWDAVFRACAAAHTVVEIDSGPSRLDLPADLIRRALRHGVKFSVDSDAHATGQLANIRYGVGTAQRGWLTADDVVNTWPLERLLQYVRGGGS